MTVLNITLRIMLMHLESVNRFILKGSSQNNYNKRTVDESGLSTLFNTLIGIRMRCIARYACTNKEFILVTEEFMNKIIRF